MMKNQLAGLMKQAQAMQDNLKQGAGGARHSSRSKASPAPAS